MKLIFSRIKFIFIFVATGLLISVSYHFYMEQVLGLHFPWNTFLMDPHYRFSDWDYSLISVANMDPYFTKGKVVATYFPFAYAIFSLCNGLSHDIAAAIFVSVSIFLCTISLSCYWCIFIRSGFKVGETHYRYFALLAGAIFLSYPYIFGLDRGNIDCWISMLELFFVVLLRTRFRWLGLIALSMAIAMKGYPAALLLLAIADREYIRTLFSLLLTIGLTLFALLLFKGGIAHNWQGFQSGMVIFHEQYVVGFRSANFSADPYNALRRLNFIPASSQRLLVFYHVFSTSFALLVAFFILFAEVPRWRQVMAACLIILLFPDIANDYKLLSLYPGMLMLIADKAKGRREKISLLCLAWLMIPKQYIFIGYITVSMFISPYILLLLAWSTLGDKTAWQFALRLFPEKLRWYVMPLWRGKSMDGIIYRAGDDGDACFMQPRIDAH